MENILHIYTRVSSTLQQEEGTSLDNQKQLGIKKAAELGFDFHLWNEGGQSSFHDDLTNRPVLVSLLSLFDSGTVKHLFVYNTDRLSRNQQTWAVIRYKLLVHGVTLHTVSGQMALKNPVDDLMLGILSEISQYDNRIRAERSRLGRFQKVQQGNWKGGPPAFGYRLEQKRLEIDPFESEWIKKIYDWYCCGVSVKNIQSNLSHHGVMTRRGNPQWSLGSIQFILRNPVYVGYFDYTDKMVGETVRIQTTPIVDAQVFQIAQDRRKINHKSKNQVNPSKHFYLLRDVLICGHCGTPMGGRIHSAGHQHLYYCVNKKRTWKTRGDDTKKWKRGSNCSMLRSINIGKTDELVWGMVKMLLLDLQERPTLRSEIMNSPLLDFDEQDGFTTAGLTWLSPKQLGLLSNEERKVIINQLITRVSVFFDASQSKHHLDVEFSEIVSSVFGHNSVEKVVYEDSIMTETWHSELSLRGDSVKKHWSSGVYSATEQV